MEFLIAFIPLEYQSFYKNVLIKVYKNKIKISVVKLKWIAMVKVYISVIKYINLTS